MTRILYIAPYFWPEEIGSAPYCSELAFHMSVQGHTVQTIAFRPHYPSIEPFGAWSDGSRDLETQSGVTIERVAVTERGAGGFRDRVKNDLRLLGKLLYGAVSGRYRHTEVIVAYVPSILTLYGARMVRALTGAPILAVVHDIESGLASALGIAKSHAALHIMRLVEKIGLNFAQQVVALTEGMASELRSIGCIRNIEVISIWGQASEECLIDPLTKPVLSYSGNFGKKQNLDQLLPLLSRLSQEGRDVDVVMRGGGSELNRFKAIVADQGIHNVRFLPLVAAAELTRAQQSANIHLVPQAANVANYALPSKVFSIMAAGRPFVCIAIPRSPLDLLAARSGAGLSVPPGDDTALYDAVTKLLDDPTRQIKMGRMGQDFIRSNLGRSKILTRFENLICKIAGRDTGMEDRS